LLEREIHQAVTSFDRVKASLGEVRMMHVALIVGGPYQNSFIAFTPKILEESRKELSHVAPSSVGLLNPFAIEPSYPRFSPIGNQGSLRRSPVNMPDYFVALFQVEALHVLPQVLCEPAPREFEAVGPKGPGRFRSAGVGLGCFLGVAQPEDLHDIHPKIFSRPIWCTALFLISA
jgi:hypothetical protein